MTMQFVLRLVQVGAALALALSAVPAAATTATPPGGPRARAGLDGGPAPAPGSVVLDQPGNRECLMVADAGEPQVFAEGFEVEGREVTLFELRFRGGYLFGNSPPPSDVFDVFVHPSVAGRPAPAVVDGCAHPGLRASRRPGGEVGSFDLYDLVVSLPGSCRLGPNENYWLELYEAGGSGDAFGWECADTDPEAGSPGSARSTTAPGSVWFPFHRDLNLLILGAVFADGFESGDTSGWPSVTP